MTISAGFCAALIALASCNNDKGFKTPDWEPFQPSDTTQKHPSDTTDKPDVPVEVKTWTDISSRFEKLPDYVRIYKGADKLLDQNAVAYIATADMNKTTFNVWGINAPDLKGCKEPFQTPSEIFKAQGQPSVVINAGFFYKDGSTYYSSSLEVSSGKLLSPNINYASQDWVKMYYPTRAAFIEHKDGTFEAAWTYWKSAGAHWIYDSPAENKWGESPKPQPSATFPVAGRTFEAVNAIGGGPLLIRDSVRFNSYKKELFDGSTGIMPDGKHPRTAIGITGDNKLVLFVCEGRNMTEGVAGFTTGEVADILLDFGCVHAINLDGGGSTLMLVCGEEMIKPSDGKQRAVASSVFIK